MLSPKLLKFDLLEVQDVKHLLELGKVESGN